MEEANKKKIIKRIVFWAIVFAVAFYFVYCNTILWKGMVGMEEEGGYYVGMNKVYFGEEFLIDTPGFQKILLLDKVKGADAENFESLNLNKFVFKDQSDLFCKGEKLQDFSIENFEVSPGCDDIYTDGENVYALRFSRKSKGGMSCRFDVVEEADPETFRCGKVIRDDDHAYIDETPYIEISSSFHFLDKSYAVDDANVFFFSNGQLHPVEGADRQSFERVGKPGQGGRYYRDNTSVFFEGKKIEGANCETFEADGDWGYDDGRKYLNGVLQEG